MNNVEGNVDLKYNNFSIIDQLYILIVGEKNHFQQCSQSLGKELKRVIKSSESDIQALRGDLNHQKVLYEVSYLVSKYLLS